MFYVTAHLVLCLYNPLISMHCLILFVEVYGKNGIKGVAFNGSGEYQSRLHMQG